MSSLVPIFLLFTVQLCFAEAVLKDGKEMRFQIDTMDLDSTDHFGQGLDSFWVSPEDLMPYKDDCNHPKVSKVVPILTENFYNVYIELQTPKNVVKLKALDSDIAEILPIGEAENGIIIKDLPYGSAYELWAENSCSEEVLVYNLVADDSNLMPDGNIHVFSEEMFEFTKGFATQESDGALDWYDYIQNAIVNQEINYYEGVNFMQQMLLKGEKLPALYEIGQIPKKEDLPMPPTFCNCESIIFASSASPIGAGGYTQDPNDADGKRMWNELDHDIQSQTGGDGNIIKGQAFSKGAATIGYLRGDGWKTDCDEFLWQDHGVDDLANVLGSNDSHRSALRINYICNNRERLPDQCDCSRQVFFDYHYDNFVSARASLKRRSGKCNKDREAQAIARNVVGVYCDTYILKPGTQNFDNKIIFDLAIWEAAAQCSSPIREGWRDDFGDVLRALFGDLSINDVIDVINGNANWDVIFEDGASIVEIVDEINELIENGGRLEDADCGSQTTGIRGIAGGYQLELKPNTSIDLITTASPRLFVRGRRSWEAEAHINSAYGMTAVITPGIPSQEQEWQDHTHSRCCSAWGAAFNGAGFHGPINTWSNMNKMAFNLMLWNMVDCTFGGGGGRSTRGELGSCSRWDDNIPEFCDVEYIDANRLRSQDRNNSFEEIKFYQWNVFGVSGIRYDSGEMNAASIDSVVKSIRGEGNLSTGIYILQILDEHNNSTNHKIFIP